MKKMRLLVILSLLVTSITYSDIKLDSSKLQNKTIEKGKNGSTIINISTPNGKGISVNDFENFQAKNGVIFNNSKQKINISQLEGIISNNPNITGDQAKLILNRVGGSNRTEIEGVMEAIGKEKVDMIFSSPNGIYLDGAKFIGFKDVTFTTAPAELNSEGNIQNLTINKGKVEIGRNGLDASKLEQLSLLSKQITIDGQVKGKNISLISGDFDYNINNKSYTRRRATNNSVTISSSEFGSIYGDQINIIATNGELGIKGDIISNDSILLIGDIIAIDSFKRHNIYGALKAENEITIELDGYGRIYGSLESKSLVFNHLDSSRIEIYGEIITDVLTVKPADKKDHHVNGVFNHGTITAGEVNINAIPYFDNYGTFFASDINLIEYGANINNYGLMVVMNNINKDKVLSGPSYYGKASLNNTKDLIVGGDIKVRSINNTGNAEVYGDIWSDWVSNRKEAFLKVEGSIYFKDLVNSGEIDTQGLVGIGNSSNNFLNEGKFNIYKSYVGYGNSYYKTFINKGILNVDEVDIKSLQFENLGEINTQILKITSKGDGLILSHENLELKAKKIENSGELNGKNLKLVFKDFSSQGGKLTSDKISFEYYTE